MSLKIDVIYHDGEIVAYRNQSALSSACSSGKPTLIRALKTPIEFRFCNTANTPETIIAQENFSHAQILLSCRDRLLSCSEEGIVLFTDEDGFQTLRIEKLNIDTPDVRSLLADSYLDLETCRHGLAECELSIAIYSSSDERSVQLFFTMDVIIKNSILA